MKRAPTYTSEADMCAAFIAALPPEYVAYAETAGWDILLVRKGDGFQIGVEAKLTLNAHVLTQALEGDNYEYVDAGPDCRAILVPSREGYGFETIAAHLALTVIKMGFGPQRGSSGFSPSLPPDGQLYTWRETWHELCPIKRHTLPDYIPDVTAGASGPTKLTTWKIAAIKVAVLLEKRGYVTRHDFRSLKIDPRRWLDGRWLVRGDAGLVRGTGFPDFKQQHPRNYGEIEADFETWASKLPAVKQEAMAI